MSLADRRSVSRFRIVGEPSGTLDALAPLSVRTLSSDGMLIESPNPLELGPIHEFQLIDGKSSVRVRAAVRSVSPLRQSSAEGCFLVDLELLNLNSRSSVALERWLNGQSAPSTHREA